MSLYPTALSHHVAQSRRPAAHHRRWARVGHAASRAGHIVVEAALVLGIGAVMAAGAMFLR